MRVHIVDSVTRITDHVTLHPWGQSPTLESHSPENSTIRSTSNNNLIYRICNLEFSSLDIID